MLKRSFRFRNFSVFNQEHPFIKNVQKQFDTIQGEKKVVGKPRIGDFEDYELLKQYVQSIDIKNENDWMAANNFHSYMIKNHGKMISQNMSYHFFKAVSIWGSPALPIYWCYGFSHSLIYAGISSLPICINLFCGEFGYLNNKFTMKNHVGIYNILKDVKK